MRMITDKAEWDKVMAESNAEGKPVIIDFFAEWCGPCKVIAPKFAEFAEKFSNLIFIKVDVDAAEEVAKTCNISAMPTFQVWKNGEKTDEVVGAQVAKLLAMIEKAAA